ncbi:hypothetical protein Voc01_074960 [Virgisporangium ochraceum]|uniref:Uncharacterized protein n=1 Tax=Virgisporangium ochraceum TaxID=65505 RepID=A0A8J4EF97_9ACTN|nr:hypothetical protein [Virgisporangium ochraceum]GIJ72579.1 hypothetical protein Voc01_074960 [Virgisporangium ochraceum]
MPEPEAARPGLLHDDAGRQRRVEVVEGGVGVASRDGREEVDVVVAADDGRRPQEVAGRLRQPFDASGDHIGDRGRDVARGGQAQQLHEEERVAVGAFAQRPGAPLPRFPAGRRPDQLGDPGVGQAGQVEPERMATAQRGTDLGQHPRRFGMGAAGRDQEHPRVDDVVGDVAQQPQRRMVGPVQVVERDHQRATGRGGHQQARDRVEDVEALHLGVDRRSTGRGRPADGRGQQAGEPFAVGEVADHVGAERSGQVALDAGPRPERRRAAPDAQLVGERATDGPQRLQRVGLPPRAGQRQRAQRPQPFPQRVLPCGRRQLDRDGRLLAEAQPHQRQILDRQQPCNELSGDGGGSSPHTISTSVSTGTARPVQHQRGEDRPLLGCAHVHRPTVVDDLERTQHRDTHATSLRIGCRTGRRADGS